MSDTKPPEQPVQRRRWLRIVLATATASLVLLAAVAVLVWLNRPSPARSGARPADPPSGEPRATGTCTWLEPPANPARPVERPVERPRFDPEVDGRAMLAVIRTNLGVVEIKLFGDEAPCTVSSFRHLAALGYYDQTDCPLLLATPGAAALHCGGAGFPGYAVPAENPAAERQPASPRGTVGMAHDGLAGPSGSGFFIVYADSPALAPRYTVLGQVVTGLDIVERVGATGHDGATGGPRPSGSPTGLGRPRQQVTILAIAVLPIQEGTGSPSVTS